MQRYDITGMSCAACASHVEKPWRLCRGLHPSLSAC